MAEMCLIVMVELAVAFMVRTRSSEMRTGQNNLLMRVQMQNFGKKLFVNHASPASLMTRVVPPRRRKDATTSITGHFGPGANGV